MGPHPDDVTAAGDFSLVDSARHGDRLAFGVLYLRHHAAAWRIACVASRFSPDAELAVIEGFTRLFSALPEEAEEFGTGTVTLRPYVLACARQAALDRADTAGRAERPGAPAPAPLAGLGPDGEVVLSTLDHHVARGALAALPERSRTALWLFDVEAMTPAEVAGIIGGRPEDAVALADSARADYRAAQEAVLAHHEVRAGCRFTVEHLDAYRATVLEPSDGLIVRSHLDRCPPCRMRHGELADAPAALAAAVPAAPLLGGEAQQHWLTNAATAQPAERLLPPAAAAGAPARSALTRGLFGRRPAGRFRTADAAVAAVGMAAATGPAGGLPEVLRRAGRAATRSWRSPDDTIVDLTAVRSPDAAVAPGEGPVGMPAGQPSGAPAGKPDGMPAEPPAGKPDGMPAEPPAGTGGPAMPPGWTNPPWSSGSFTPPLPPAWTLPPARAAADSARTGDPARADGGARPAGITPGAGGGARPAGITPGAGGGRPAGITPGAGGARPAEIAPGAGGGRRRRAARATRTAGTAGSGRPPDQRAAGDRRPRRTVWPVVTAVTVVAAWLLGMVAVPWLMMPGTAPGPDGLALPAVQAYASGLLPDPRPAGSGAGPDAAAVAEPASAGGDVAGAAGTESASPAPAAPSATEAMAIADGGPTAAALATALLSPAPPAHRPGPPPASAVAAVAAPIVGPLTVAAATPPPIVGPVTAPSSTGPVAAATPATAPARPPDRPVRSGHSGTPSGRGGPAAVVPDRPAPTTGPPTTRRPARRPNGRQARIRTA